MWIILSIIVLSAIGIFFLLKKMKVGKGDWIKLKKKFKKKKSPEQEAFDNGEILVPIDKRDYADFDNFREGVKNNSTISEKLDGISKEFKDWKPLEEKKDKKEEGEAVEVKETPEATN